MVAKEEIIWQRLGKRIGCSPDCQKKMKFVYETVDIKICSVTCTEKETVAFDLYMVILGLS